MITNPPTEVKEFPIDTRDAIDQRLRSALNTQDRPKVQSVRPERQVPPIVRTNPEAYSQPQQATQPSQPSQPANTVPNVSPLPTPMVSEDYVSLDLPSRFAYYPFKDLYVRPFSVKHLSKLARAQQESSLQMLAEVVSSVLTTPAGHTNAAFYLSTADFNAVLYWLRLNSFSKKQMRYNWICQHDEHRVKVEKKLLSPESLRNTLIYKETDIEVVYLDNKPNEEAFTLRFTNGREPIKLVPENIMTTIEFMDDPQKRWDDPEFQFSAKLASHLDLPVSLSERIAFVENYLETDHVPTIQEFAKLMNEYGIKETVESKCMECGVSQQVPLTVDTSCFLSPEF
jgi:hypothetical protein